ncbi:18746_t:CDS:2 [Entrophospora sp. SA101]|nr:18746_t:CDS:2 [Entrophospora sp. SA101]
MILIQKKFDPTSNTLKGQQILLFKEKIDIMDMVLVSPKVFLFVLSKYKIHTTLPTQEFITAATITQLNQEFIAAATTAQLNQESTTTTTTQPTQEFIFQ